MSYSRQTCPSLLGNMFIVFVMRVMLESEVLDATRVAGGEFAEAGLASVALALIVRRSGVEGDRSGWPDEGFGFASVAAEVPLLAFGSWSPNAGRQGAGNVRASAVRAGWI